MIKMGRHFGKSTELLTAIPNLQNRFERHVISEPMSGCFLWTAATTRRGYGKFMIDYPKRKTNWLAHRVSYFLHYGLFDGNLDVLHKCDNPPCVNPRHLFLGTALDNSKDRSAKGKAIAPMGDDHYQSKLTCADIQTVFEMRAARIGPQIIADKFGVTYHSISDIVNRRTWRHVQIDEELIRRARAIQRKSPTVTRR